MTALHTALAVLASCTTRAARRVTKGARDAGASALEFAIIAAIVVVAASVVGAVIYNVVEDRSGQLEDCASQPIGSEACAP
jgi:hypothetical protein